MPSIAGTQYCELTADHTKVAADMPDAGGSFAATLVIDEAAGVNWEGGAAALVAGLSGDLSDLRVTNAAADAGYPWGRLHWDQGSGILKFNFRVPSTDKLLAASDTTYRVYRGGTGGTTEDKAGVVRTADGNVCYLPLEEAAGDLLDWTTNGLDGARNGCAQAAGRIAYGQIFDGDDITVAVQTLADATFGVWIYPTNTAGINAIYRAAGSHGIYIVDGVVRLQADGWKADVAIPADEWSYVALRLDDAANLFTLSVENASAGYLSDTAAWAATFRFLHQLGNDTWNQGLEGTLDELVLHNVVRSTDWLATYYQMAADPNAFWKIGALQGEVVPPIHLAQLARETLIVDDLQQQSIHVADLERMGLHVDLD